MSKPIIDLLRETRATLEMWKDVAPAVSLCADIDKALAAAAHQQQEPVAWSLREAVLLDDLREARDAFHRIHNAARINHARDTARVALRKVSDAIARARAAQPPQPAQDVVDAARIETVVIDGHQLREALNFLNPDGEADPDQLDEYLEFGIVKHQDDDGKISTGLCCWNEDTDGVYPLTGHGAYAEVRPTEKVQDVDQLQGTVNWLTSIIHDLDVVNIQQRLSIDYNRAKRLLEIAMRSNTAAEEGE